MLSGFADVGTITGETSSVVRAKIYGSSGLAVRIQNPDLVFEAVEMRVALLNSIDDKGVQVGFHVGGPDSPEIQFPGTRPGGFAFR